MDERIARTFARLARKPPKFTDWLGDHVQAPPVTLGSFVTTMVVLVVGMIAHKVLPIPVLVVLVVALVAGGVYWTLQELQLGSPQLYGHGVLMRLADRVERVVSRYRRIPRPRGVTRKGPA